MSPKTGSLGRRYMIDNLISNDFNFKAIYSKVRGLARGWISWFAWIEERNKAATPSPPRIPPRGIWMAEKTKGQASRRSKSFAGKSHVSVTAKMSIGSVVSRSCTDADLLQMELACIRHTDAKHLAAADSLACFLALQPQRRGWQQTYLMWWGMR